MTLLHRERLVDVHPDLVHLVEEAALEFHPAFDIAVVSGFRTQLEQTALYEKGRVTPGRIVTNARSARETAHGRGAALDVCPVLAGKWLWDDVEKFQVLGDYFKARDFVWGGDFKGLVDRCHVELAHWHELLFDDDKTPTDLHVFLKKGPK